MIKGLYAAASAMLAGVHRQSSLAHNVSNMDTPGFKQVMISLKDFRQVPVIQPPVESSVNGRIRQVGHLGLGVQPDSQEDDFSAGSLQFTGHTLDFAIQGPGFFQVQTPEGIRYTRDGRFNRDANGQLVTVDGYLALDEAGQPITLPENASLTASEDGALFVDGAPAGRLGVAAFNDPAAELTRDSPNTFIASGQPSNTELGIVVQGYLEASNVNAAQLMTQMVQVARHYEAAHQMVQNQDDLLGRAIATLGKL